MTYKRTDIQVFIVLFFQLFFRLEMIQNKILGRGRKICTKDLTPIEEQIRLASKLENMFKFTRSQGQAI